MFKVGDAVRVKAGSPQSLWQHFDHSDLPGKKLVVCHAYLDVSDKRVHVISDNDPKTERVANIWHLEPWNDSEEWDGEKWVPKKLADEITINGVTYVRKAEAKTNAEKLEQYFAKNLFIKNTFSDLKSNICSARIASISRTGNFVTVTYDASGD